MGVIRALVTVVYCGIRGHDLHRMTDWAGRWALCRGWWLYECRRCRKRIRRDEELMIGGRYV